MYGMVMINDYVLSVTGYPTEDAAYNDIIDTVLESPGWLDGLMGDDAVAAVRAKILGDRELTTPRIVYERHIEPHMKSFAGGYWMDVVTIGVPHEDPEREPEHGSLVPTSDGGDEPAADPTGLTAEILSVEDGYETHTDDQGFESRDRVTLEVVRSEPDTTEIVGTVAAIVATGVSDHREWGPDLIELRDEDHAFEPAGPAFKAAVEAVKAHYQHLTVEVAAFKRS